MKKENPLLGIWLADLTRWSVDAGNIAPVVWLTLGRLRVEFQEKNMSIQNYGVRPTTNAVYRFIVENVGNEDLDQIVVTDDDLNIKVIFLLIAF